jgi:6-phosphofructokinase 1
MRSGAPYSLDWMVAVSFWWLACDQVAMGHTLCKETATTEIYTTVPLDMVVAGKKRVDVTALYDSQNYRPRVRDMLGKPMFLY